MAPSITQDFLLKYFIAIKIFFDRSKTIESGMNISDIAIRDELRKIPHISKSFLPKEWETKVSIAPQRPSPLHRATTLFTII